MESDTKQTELTQWQRDAVCAFILGTRQMQPYVPRKNGRSHSLEELTREGDTERQ